MKGKVRIVVGVMTREQDSDSTLPSEGKEKEMEISSPRRVRGGTDILSLSVVLLPMDIGIVRYCINT